MTTRHEPMDQPVPLERDVIIDGLRIHYLAWRQRGGSPLVFLHGGGLNAHTWDPVAAAVSERYECYAIDLRGHGDSEWSPTLDYGLDAHARDLTGFVDRLELERFVLIGHSLGGYTAMKYAVHQSHRLAGLVVVDITPFVADGPNVERVRRFMLDRSDFGSIDDAVHYSLDREASGDTESRRRSIEYALRQRADGRWIWKYDRRHLDDSYFAAAISEFRSLADHLGRVRCPTLVVRGSDGCSAEDASRFAALLPDATLVTITNAGHNVHRDNPGALINALEAFLGDHHTVEMAHEPEQLTSLAELRAVYRPPAQRSLDKEIDHLDVHCRDFLAHSPLVVLATAAGDGSVDASPKGGPPGFVGVLDDRRLAIPDMAGNNRLDSMRNIINGGPVGLLCLVPGIDETLRINGCAHISTDPAVLDRCPVGELRPNVAIVIEVRTAFIHCAKALRRAALWHPDRWPDTTGMATPACMLKDHIGLTGSVEDSQRALDAAYAATTWKVAGAE